MEGNERLKKEETILQISRELWGTSENDENSSQSYFIVKSEEDIFQTKEKSVVQGEIRATIKGCNVYNILLKYKIVGIKLNRKT